MLEHLENLIEFLEEARRVPKGVFEYICPTDSMTKKKTFHNLLSLRRPSAFKWKTKLTGTEKINYGGTNNK